MQLRLSVRSADLASLRAWLGDVVETTRRTDVLLRPAEEENWAPVRLWNVARILSLSEAGVEYREITSDIDCGLIEEHVHLQARFTDETAARAMTTGTVELGRWEVLSERYVIDGRPALIECAGPAHDPRDILLVVEGTDEASIRASLRGAPIAPEPVSTPVALLRYKALG